MMEKQNTDAGLRQGETALPSPSGNVLHPLYVSIGEMGADPSGILYSAKYEVDGSKVLVKALAPGLAVDPSAWKDPPEEALRLRDTVTGIHKETLVVLSYPKATPLKRILARQGQMTVRPALSIAVQVLRALVHFHAQGHLVGTLNPGALFLSRTPKGKLMVRVAFLGLAPSALPVNHEAYRPPEALVGGHRPSPGDDLWATAVLLYEILFGLTPFAAGKSYFPPAMASEYPEVVEALKVALQTKPSERFQTATAFLQALTGEKSVRDAISGEASAAFPVSDSEPVELESIEPRSSERSSLPTVPSPPRASLVGETLQSDDDVTRPYSIPPLEPSERGRQSRGEQGSGRPRRAVWIAAAAVLIFIPAAIWVAIHRGDSDEMSQQKNDAERAGAALPSPAANSALDGEMTSSDRAETSPVEDNENENAAGEGVVPALDSTAVSPNAASLDPKNAGEEKSEAERRRGRKKKPRARVDSNPASSPASTRKGPTDNLSSNPFPLKNNPFPGSN